MEGEELALRGCEDPSLLMDARTRAQLRRTEPWEVRGAYEWVKKAKRHSELSHAGDGRLMQLTRLVAEVREEDKKNKTLGQSLRSRARALSREDAWERHLRRLLASDRSDIDNRLAKIIRLLKKSVPIVDLVATAVYWGEDRRRRIAQDYFAEERNNDAE